MNFKEDMIPLYQSDFDLIGQLRSLFFKYPSLTFSQIKKLLLIEDDDKLANALCNYLVKFGAIIRDDFWEGESIYHNVQQYYQKSAYTRGYYSFSVNQAKNKKFLLISDTHIGNLDMEDFKLLDKVYDKACSLGSTHCFHLGDIFEGVKKEEYLETEIERQLELFIKNYPNPKEMMTYALLGNHDSWIYGYNADLLKLKDAYFYDLRYLSHYLPSFKVFNRDLWTTSFQDIDVLFTHHLYINGMLSKKWMHQLEDIKNEEHWVSSDYSLLISGHLHCGFCYSINDQEKEKLFLGVPSTSKINLNSVVAYFCSMNYIGDVPSDIEITPLIVDDHYQISMGEALLWKFREKNKVYQKEFKLTK